MELIKGGLGAYAKFQTYMMIFFGIILCLAGSFIGYRVKKSNYQKAKSAEIAYYKTDTLSKCTPVEVSNKQCELKVSYKDASSSNEYKQIVDSKAKQGPVSVYYKKDDPTSYKITPSPYLLTGMLICGSLIILVIGFIRYKIIKSNENGGAALGAVDVVSNIFSGPSSLPSSPSGFDSSPVDVIDL